MATTKKSPPDPRFDFADDDPRDEREGGERPPEMFLIILGLLMLNRAALYFYLEQGVEISKVEANVANILFGITGVPVFGYWLILEARRSGWFLIPECMFLIVTMTISASLLTGGNIWDGNLVIGMYGRPRLALGLMLGALLITATPFWIWFIRAGVAFVSDPVGIVRKLFAGVKL